MRKYDHVSISLYSKRVMLILLAFVLVMASTACTSTVSDEQAQKDIEKTFGDFKQLPMDMDDILEKLSDDVLVESSDSTDGSTKSTTIVVGDGVALYSSVMENTDQSSNGQEYGIEVTVIHLGSAKSEKDNAYSLHFIGANIKMEIDSVDPEAVRQELLGQIDQMELSDDDASLMKDLINGKQIHASTSSYLWELYSEVSVDVQATYDAETGSFIVKQEDTYDKILEQYSYKLLDFKGRVIEEGVYKIDDSGTKWITDKCEYTYLSNGSVKEYYVRYCTYTNQIESESEGLINDGGTDCPLWSRTYLDDGTMINESYTDENGNYVEMEYFNDGSVKIKSIFLPSTYEDGRFQLGQQIYFEEYTSPGKLWRRNITDGTIITEEFYFENGYLKEAATFDMSRTDEDGGIRPIQTKTGDENGEVKENNYDDGKLISTVIYRPDGSKSVTDYGEYKVPILTTVYFASGKIQAVTEYKNGYETKTTHYDEDGNVIQN